MTPLEIAHIYKQCGFPVFPVNGHKKPIIPSWEPFQNRFPTDEELDSWFGHKEKANIAIVTGPMSNLLVVDGDEHRNPGICAEIEKRIPREQIVPVQLTPSGGKHYCFAYEPGFINKADYTNGLDIRSRGGYIVGFPSLTLEGKEWRWLEDQAPWQIPLVPMPEPLRSWIKSLDGSRVGPSSGGSIQDWFKDGRRDNDLFHLAYLMAKGGAEADLMKEVLTRISLSWGERNEKWIQAKIESALKRAEKRESSVTPPFILYSRF